MLTKEGKQTYTPTAVANMSMLVLHIDSCCTGLLPTLAVVQSAQHMQNMPYGMVAANLLIHHSLVG